MERQIKYTVVVKWLFPPDATLFLHDELVGFHIDAV